MEIPAFLRKTPASLRGAEGGPGNCLFLNVDVFRSSLDADGSVFLKVVAFLRGDDAREREGREVEFVPEGDVSVQSVKVEMPEKIEAKRGLPPEERSV